MARTTLACHCLNIQINEESATLERMPASSKESGFTWIYVGDSGLHVKYPGATSRERLTRSPSSMGSGSFEEIQSVKCLLCRRIIYKVRIDQFSVASNPKYIKYIVDDVALKSVDGWIQVAVEECLKGDKLNEALVSSTYSSALSLSLPASAFSPKFTRDIHLATLPLPEHILPDLPQFVEPPPFSPSHPAFLAFSKAATQTSKAFREKLETEIKAFIRTQLSTLDQEEARIYSELESAWQLFKSGYKKELEIGRVLKDGGHNGISTQNTSLKAFSLTRSTSTSQPPKKSSLSVSLSKNSMNYIPPITRNSEDDGSIVDDDSFGNDAALKDHAVSSRVFELELHDARAKATNTQQRLRQRMEDGNKAPVTQSVPISAFRRAVSNPESGGSPAQDVKGKRKVTFNSKLAVRTIETSTKKSKPIARRSVSTEEEIFDLDSVGRLDGEREPPFRSLQPRPVSRRKSSSPLSSPPHFASSFSNSIFSSLKPNSLPAIDSALVDRTQSSNIIETREEDTTLEQDEDTLESGTEDENEFTTPGDTITPEESHHLGPSSLPIPMNPAWESFSKPRQSNHRLGTIQEREEYFPLPEYVFASTAPTARTFQERADEVLRMVSKPEAKPRSQKSIRRKIYEEVDRRRHVDPGPEFSGEDGSDTDTESVTRDARTMAIS